MINALLEITYCARAQICALLDKMSTFHNLAQNSKKEDRIMYQFAFALYRIKVSMAIRKQWDGVVVCIPSPHLSHPSISPIPRKQTDGQRKTAAKVSGGTGALTWDPRTTVTLAMAN
jgi:hypothetical protein